MRLKFYIKTTSVIIFALTIYYFWGKPFRNSYHNYQNWKIKNTQLQKTIAHIRKQVVAKKYFIRKLMTDAAFRERFIREKNGFLHPNERIIFFKTRESVELENEKSLQNHIQL